MNITILGAGSWGSALAISLVGRHRVMLWGRNYKAMQNAAKTHEHQGFVLPAELLLSSDLEHALAHVNQPGSLLIIGTSVAGLRPMAQALRPYKVRNLVWLCKGLEEGTLQLPHQIVQQELGSALPCGALSGPSFAQEVARGLPCALTIASEFPELAELVVKALHGPALRVYSSTDVVGVEVGGAVKNFKDAMKEGEQSKIDGTHTGQTIDGEVKEKSKS